jgi:plastocyanin
MHGIQEPGNPARRHLMRGALGAGLIVVIGRTAAAADANIMIGNFKFSPTPLTVSPGTTVTWLNRDDMIHSIVVPALGLRSQPLDTDETFAYRFDKAGTYDYVCGLHPFMHGQIIVRAV